MIASPDHLYNLIPVIYRQRDAEAGYPLRALLQVISEQVNLVEADITQLYENWFIETAQDWVVPYIADLLGYEAVGTAGQPGDPSTPSGLQRNKILIPRRDVANTVRYRRRKGTLALLEQLAFDVAGWPARVVEFYRLLGFAQSLNYQRPDRGRLVDLRDGQALDLLGGPFDPLAHRVDVRRINSDNRPRGLHNRPNVGLFVWRLKSYSVTRSPAYNVEEAGPHCYSLHVLVNDAPLFTRPEREASPTSIAGVLNVPAPIRMRALAERRLAFDGVERGLASPRYYGPGKSLAIWVPRWPTRTDNPDGQEPLSADRIIIADLSRWDYRPPKGFVAVDPLLGRLVFPPSQAPKKGVRVSYQYGFSADLGGGEYDRPKYRSSSQPQPEVFTVSGRRSLDGPANDIDPLEKALNEWDRKRRQSAQPFHAVIEITDSDVYTPRLPRIELNPFESLELRAANRARPVLRLLDYRAESADALTVALSPGSRFTLDGLWISGRGVHVEAYEPPVEGSGEETGYLALPAPETETTLRQRKQDQPALEKPPVSAPMEGPKPQPEDGNQGEECPPPEHAQAVVTIRHCTLVPGWLLQINCEPIHPSEPSLEIYNVDARVSISHSILGSIQIHQDEVATDPIPLSISDSILDATGVGCDGPECEALGAPDSAIAHVLLTVQRSTVLGKIMVHAIQLAENSIFMDMVRVARSQIGCMRFSYVDPHLPGARTPRRYNCQPDLAEKAVEAAEQDKSLWPALKARAAARVRPQFNSTRYANPDYCQLSQDCAEQILRGADDESEMGVFHDLYQPQRAAALQARLDEYTPAGMDAGIIFAS